MKKLIMSMALTVLVLFSLIAAESNLQKIYPVSSSEYETIKYVYIMSGHSFPSSSGPWSGDELLEMVENIYPSLTDSSLLRVLDEVRSSITEKKMIETKYIDLSFRDSLTPEFYFHTNTDGYERETVTGIKEKAFQNRGMWVYGTMDQKPFYTLDWETWAAGSFYALFEINLQNSTHSGENYTKELGFKHLSSNILFLQNMEFEAGLIDGNFPNRAFVSGGGKGWSIQIGRDRISWGLGETGNMSISNNLPYHDMLRFTIYSDSFKYTFLTSFFPHPMNYYEKDETSKIGQWKAMDNFYNTLHGLRFYTAHRVEGRFFNDRVTLTLTEGLMYMTEDNTIDIRAFNPVNFNHNNYTAANSNSTLAFEADWTVVKGINIYGEFIIDEIAFPGVETSPSAENRTRPSAYGALLGVHGVFMVKGGFFHTSLEAAKTDPFLYLRYGDDTPYGIDYVVALRNWSTSSNAITYDEYALGYTYGPDAIVANLNAEWVSADSILRFGGNVFFMAHGTHDIWSVWTEVGGTEEDYSANGSTPTEKHTMENRKYKDAAVLRNSVEYTTVYSLTASMAFLDSLSGVVEIDYIDIFNYGNEKGVRQKDFQTVISLTWTF